MKVTARHCTTRTILLEFLELLPFVLHLMVFELNACMVEKQSADKRTSWYGQIVENVLWHIWTFELSIRSTERSLAKRAEQCLLDLFINNEA